MDVNERPPPPPPPTLRLPANPESNSLSTDLDLNAYDSMSLTSKASSVSSPTKKRLQQFKLFTKKKLKAFAKATDSSSSNSTGSQDSSGSKSVYFYETINQIPHDSTVKEKSISGLNDELPLRNLPKLEHAGSSFIAKTECSNRNSKYYDCRSNRSSGLYCTPTISQPDLKIFDSRAEDNNSMSGDATNAESNSPPSDDNQPTTKTEMPFVDENSARHMSICSRLSGVRSLSTYSYSSVTSLETIEVGNPIVRWLKPHFERIISKIENPRSYGGLRIRIFNLLIKLLTCVLYIVRVILDDDPISANCFGCPGPENAIFKESQNKTDEQFMEYPIINWKAIIWVNRPLPLWAFQVAVSIVSLSEALLLAYLNYKGNIWQILKSFYFMLEMVNTIPFVLTVSL
ncbi:hypothetical protein FHG87_006301 [Trinorchestia longiramus]|nr:hypothetical protein FHG87_006301 [Trinorchestia longiramus]